MRTMQRVKTYEHFSTVRWMYTIQQVTVDGVQQSTVVVEHIFGMLLGNSVQYIKWFN